MKKSILKTICAKLKEWFLIPECVTKEDILDATKPGEFHYGALDIAVDRLTTRLGLGTRLHVGQGFRSKLYSILSWTITVIAAPATGWGIFFSWIFGRIFVIRVAQYMCRRCHGWNTLVSINYIYLGIYLWICIIIPIPNLVAQLGK